MHAWYIILHFILVYSRASHIHACMIRILLYSAGHACMHYYYILDSDDIIPVSIHNVMHNCVIIIILYHTMTYHPIIQCVVYMTLNCHSAINYSMTLSACKQTTKSVYMHTCIHAHTSVLTQYIYTGIYIYSNEKRHLQ